MSKWIAGYFYIFLAISVVIPFLLCFMHLMIYGPNRIQSQSAILNVLRFNRWERGVHGIRSIAFFTAIISGGFAIVKGSNGQLWSGIHEPSANLFLLASIVAVIICFKDMLPRQYDLDWLAHRGGYFSRVRQPYPAGRFNAGQKISFWLSLILIIITYISGDSIRGGGTIMLTLHITSSLSLLAVVVFHAYLSTIANPGTFGVLIHGRVSDNWARHHHPMWTYKKIE